MGENKEKQNLDEEQNNAYGDDTTEEVNDVTNDVDETELSPEAAQTVQNLKQKLADCRKERQEYLDGWQRAKADLVNARSSATTEANEHAERSIDNLVLELLQVIDSFEAAFADTEAWESVDPQWRSGVENIYTQLKRVLSHANVAPIETEEGQSFDPTYHEPVETVAADTHERDNTIAGELQRGYQRGERVIRPTKVRVAQYTDDSNSET